MSQLIIQDLDETLLVQLKRRAWEQGLPLQELLRRYIQSGLDADDGLAGHAIVMPQVYRVAGRSDTLADALQL